MVRSFDPVATAPLSTPTATIPTPIAPLPIQNAPLPIPTAAIPAPLPTPNAPVLTPISLIPVPTASLPTPTATITTPIVPLPTPTAPQPIYSVQFSLYNGQTDTFFTALSQGMVVNIGSIPPGNLNVVATVTGTGITPGSVNMTLSGANAIQRIENGAPYALCGNNGLDFFPCNVLTTGQYNIKAAVYSGASATGTNLVTANLDFQLVTVASPP